MNTQADRSSINHLEDIPNIGKAIAAMLEDIGITHPTMLIGKDAYKLHSEICKVKKKKIDNCVIDTFLSAIYFMEGATAHPWHYYTPERKAHLKAK